MLDAFYELVGMRQGHFRFESGHHAGRWLDLDPLFVRPERLRPFVSALAERLRPHAVDAVCGPLVGGAFVAQALAAELGAEFYFAERVAPADRDGMYGVRYRLPPSLGALVRGRRVAIVDDVISAGSAVRGTYADLVSHGAVPVVAGGLLVIGDAAAEFFAPHGIGVEAAARADAEFWTPAECPLCAAGVPLVDPT